MSKTCAKCQKTVYPIEELKCLDKIWHKGCFKCHECGMTLNMKTYKGFNKLPYCEAHIPKAKATTVAETPELKRIQENTKNQSNAVYHAEFEKSKGKFTPVVDDPESLRIKQNTKIISNVAYHGELEKKAIMEQKRNLSGEGDHNKNGVAPPKSPSYLDELGSLPTPQPVAHSQQQQQQSQYAGHPQYRQPPSNSSSYNSSSSRQGSNNYRLEEQMQPQNHSSRPMHHSQQQMSVAQHQQHREQQQQVREQQMREQMIREQQHREQQALLQQQQLQKQQQHLHRSGGQQNPSPYSSRGQPNVIYSSDGSAVNANASRKVGSIVDYDPLNNYYGSLDPQRASMQPGKSAGAGHPSYGPSSNVGQQPRTQMHHGQPQMPNHLACYRALYDYEAQDVDEVSFVDGDLIVDCTPVDEGWLTGSVQRTGKRGMLPANYVAPAN